jgi:hypothetical protein
MLALTLFALSLYFGLMQPILAQYQTQCSGCGHLIVPDEEIVEVEGDWVHADCAEDEDC